jgi:acetyltransferase-like isoleucine patch superfamily enzyme
MSSLKRLFQYSIFWRLYVSLFFAFRKVRVHPGIKLLSGIDQLYFESGIKFSRDVRIVLGPVAKFVMGKNCWVEDGVEFQSDHLISIGEGTTLRRNCSIHGIVSIGKQCILAPNVFISSGSHIYDAWPELPIREQENRYYKLPREQRPIGFEDKPVTLGDDCWLGINVVIMPGVTIGKGCVIGANSVVTKSIQPYSIAVGIPAKVIRKRMDQSS